MALVGSLLALLRADTAQFDTAMKKSGKAVGGLRGDVQQMKQSIESFKNTAEKVVAGTILLQGGVRALSSVFDALSGNTDAAIKGMMQFKSFAAGWDLGKAVTRVLGVNYKEQRTQAESEAKDVADKVNALNELTNSYRRMYDMESAGNNFDKQRVQVRQEMIDQLTQIATLANQLRDAGLDPTANVGRAVQMLYATTQAKYAAIDQAQRDAAKHEPVGEGAKQWEEMQKKAARIYEDTRTPAEAYAEQLKELQAVFASGAMDADTYNRAVDKVNADYNKKMEDEQKKEKLTTEIAGRNISAVAGSGINAARYTTPLSQQITYSDKMEAKQVDEMKKINGTLSKMLAAWNGQVGGVN